jgi:hypothetical protein
MAGCNCETLYFEDWVLYKDSWKLSLSGESTITEVLIKYQQWIDDLKGSYESIAKKCSSGNGLGTNSNLKSKFEFRNGKWEPDPLFKPPKDSGLDDTEEWDNLGVSNSPTPSQLNKNCTCIKTNGGSCGEKTFLRESTPKPPPVNDFKKIPVKFKHTVRVYEKFTVCSTGREYEEFVREETFEEGPVDVGYDNLRYVFDYLRSCRLKHTCP